jgi:hypothetical protein
MEKASHVAVIPAKAGIHSSFRRRPESIVLENCNYSKQGILTCVSMTRVFLFLACGMFSGTATATVSVEAVSYQCLTCPPGTYSNAGNTGACTQCPAGYYCPGATTKLACPGGVASPVGSMTKDDCGCAPGTYASGGSCITCTVEYYCTGNGSRTQCPAGTTSPAGSISASDCVVLPPLTGLGGQHCAPTNKNVCTPNAAWTGGSNSCYIGSTYTAWDGTSATWSTPYRATQNSYGIKASTWACNTSENIAPNAASDAQCRSGSYCWCAYSKSPDTAPSTFTSGAWSSWVSVGSSGSAAGCAYSCARNCAYSAYNSVIGGAVSW